MARRPFLLVVDDRVWLVQAVAFLFVVAVTVVFQLVVVLLVFFRFWVVRAVAAQILAVVLADAPFSAASLVAVVATPFSVLVQAVAFPVWVSLAA